MRGTCTGASPSACFLLLLLLELFVVGYLDRTNIHERKGLSEVRASGNRELCLYKRLPTRTLLWTWEYS